MGKESSKCFVLSFLPFDINKYLAQAIAHPKTKLMPQKIA